LEKRRRVLGEDHPETFQSMLNVAVNVGGQSRHAEAEKLHREVLEKRRRVLGEDHPDTLWSMSSVAHSVWSQGRDAEAEVMMLEVLAAKRRVLGDKHFSTIDAIYNLACFAALRGDRAKAIDWLRQAVANGFGDSQTMAADADLKSLHGDPAFEALLTELKGRAP